MLNIPPNSPQNFSPPPKILFVLFILGLWALGALLNSVYTVYFSPFSVWYNPPLYPGEKVGKVWIQEANRWDHRFLDPHPQTYLVKSIFFKVKDSPTAVFAWYNRVLTEKGWTVTDNRPAFSWQVPSKQPPRVFYTREIRSSIDVYASTNAAGETEAEIGISGFVE